MPRALLSRQEVVDRLMGVIRRHGYDGASLAQLSKATGLGKSSLYHHFPAVACVLGNLSLGPSRTRFGRELRAIFDQWIGALASALVDGGLSRSVARARAEDAVMRIDGALILAGAMDDVSLSGRALRQLPAELLAPVRRT